MTKPKCRLTIIGAFVNLIICLACFVVVESSLCKSVCSKGIFIICCEEWIWIKGVSFQLCLFPSNLPTILKWWKSIFVVPEHKQFIVTLFAISIFFCSNSRLGQIVEPSIDEQKSRYNRSSIQRCLQQLVNTTILLQLQKTYFSSIGLKNWTVFNQIGLLFFQYLMIFVSFIQ